MFRSSVTALVVGIVSHSFLVQAATRVVVENFSDKSIAVVSYLVFVDRIPNYNKICTSRNSFYYTCDDHRGIAHFIKSTIIPPDYKVDISFGALLQEHHISWNKDDLKSLDYKNLCHKKIKREWELLAYHDDNIPNVVLYSDFGKVDKYNPEERIRKILLAERYEIPIVTSSEDESDEKSTVELGI